MSDLTRKVVLWRENAMKEVQSIKAKKKRIQLARQYYEIDQSAMNAGEEWNFEWPEMKEIADQKIRKSPDKTKRDNLIKARSTCQRVTYYQEAWLPTLEEFREENPFDPYDDLTKPYPNKERNPDD